jgi:hypothetical protein
MKKLLILAAALALFTGAADAKWWIFGKSGTEVGLKYLLINKIAADETGPKIKVFSEMLPADGLVRISGRASTGKSAVGSVRVSLDDKATWSDVKFADNGTFEFAFKPEAGKTYAMLVEITDTAGKTNKTDETRKEISLSAENVQAKVRETLDAMFDAYNRENPEKFLSYVGENFAGDKAILERAVKRDFDALSSINLRYTINNISAGAQGRVFVSVTYNRMVFVNKTGAASTDTGSTEFVFDSKEGKLALFSMKQPLMFGLSDAENVATGSVLGGGDGLVLDETGSLGGAATVTIDCRGASWTVMKYSFGTEAQSCDTAGGGSDIWFYTWASSIGYSAPTESKIFAKTISSLTSAEVTDTAGYANTGSVAATAGYTDCFYLNAKFYCVEPITIPTAGNEVAKFKVKQF